MQNYSEMTPAARLEAIDTMATQLYGTGQWRKLFAAEYGLQPETLTSWKTKDRTPTWPCVALEHALEAQRLETLRAILNG